jgi:3'-phosphoadenosine 5'-phosphosulfate sulfotransferase (PAPS reductase)/FAD synthetase
VSTSILILICKSRKSLRFAFEISEILDLIFKLFSERKQPVDKILNDFTSLVRKAVDEYHMIDDGETVAVGVSGGKDSMLLLRSLQHLSTYYPKRFQVEAVTVELGFEGMDFTPVADMCRELGHTLYLSQDRHQGDRFRRAAGGQPLLSVRQRCAGAP